MSRQRDGLTQLKRLLQGAAIVLGATTTLAFGSLGGDAASVQADQIHMQASRRTTAAEGYTVHEMAGANGIIVREFVSPEGKVFGVAWQGPWPPDMRQVLGSYFDQYVRTAQARGGARMGRRPLWISEPGLVVQVGGHMRSFAGRAYVPEMLPSGVRAENIQ